MISKTRQRLVIWIFLKECLTLSCKWWFAMRYVDSYASERRCVPYIVFVTKVIKWRKDALHMVVIATDEQFHIAGDGKVRQYM